MKQNNILKKLHKVELDILKEFIKICEKNNLCYFLIGGTLLGAVRHKGFIPWDDDIDIGMPREDYEKFINIYSKELGSNYCLHYITTDENYYLSFAKIKKVNTFFDEKQIEKINTFKGIWIDVFPFDYISNVDSVKFNFSVRVVRSIIPIIFYKRGIISKEEVPRKILCTICSKFSIKKLFKLQKFFMTLDNNAERKYMVNFCGSYHYKKETIKVDYLFPLKELTFENIKVKVPNDYHKYLTNIYGNYMQLPPEDKRVGHLPKKIIFDTRKGNLNENKD